MVSPRRRLFWWGSIDQITRTSVPHKAHTLTHTHTQTRTPLHGAWQCRTPCGCDQTHFCFHWGPAEVRGGFDSSSILAWVLAPVSLLVFEASHIRNTCVFSKMSCSSRTLYAFSSFSFFFSHEAFEAKIKTTYAQWQMVAFCVVHSFQV